jgi:hypothetical protein
MLVLGDHILLWLTRKSFPIDEPPPQIETEDEAAHRTDDETGDGSGVEAGGGGVKTDDNWPTASGAVHPSHEHHWFIELTDSPSWHNYRHDRGNTRLRRMGLGVEVWGAYDIEQKGWF